MKYYQDQPQICLKKKKYVHLSSFTYFFFKGSHKFIKKHEIFSEAACCTKHIHFAWSQSQPAAQNIYTLHEDFHNLSMIMKNTFDGWLKTLFRNLTAVYEYYQPRHNAYRNKQIIQACLALMSLCLVTDPKANILGLVNIFPF